MLVGSAAASQCIEVGDTAPAPIAMASIPTHTRARIRMPTATPTAVSPADDAPSAQDGAAGLGRLAQAAANPAVVSVSVSPSIRSQPCETAYVQASLNSGIFQSPISDVSASSSSTSLSPIRQLLP